jgi:hypothetical protein
MLHSYFPIYKLVLDILMLSRPTGRLERYPPRSNATVRDGWRVALACLDISLAGDLSHPLCG